MSDETNKEGLTRREFIERAAKAGLGIAGASAFGLPLFGGDAAVAAPAVKKGGKPVVVVAKDAGIWKSGKLDRDAVRELVFKAVRELSGEKSNEAAWSEYFDKDDRVSIKMNCIGGKQLSSSPAVVSAVAAGLIAAGIPGNRIAAWDRFEWELRNSGYKPGRGKDGVLYTSTDSDDFGYEGDIVSWGEVGTRVSTIATRFSSAIVNVPVMKDHDSTGVSCALKNYFGAINNPNKLHEDGCDPYIADLNMLPVFKNKTKLTVCDATTGQYHGGPAHKSKYTWRFSGVIVGTDMVAVDAVVNDIIEKKRKEEGLPTLSEEGRPPKFLKTAADPKHRLGECRLDKIKVIEV